jgi:enoyl-CoA hydratase/carnithine racemase
MPKRKNTIRVAAALAAATISVGAAQAADPAYFSKYESLRMSRDKGVLVVEMHTKGGAITFSAKDHDQFVDAFYEIGRDRSNRVVILTGAGGDWMGKIDFSSFGNVSDPDIWSKVHDEGTQILENIANIRVPMICAVEGKAWIHTEYCLLSNVIVAGEGATFNDAPHFAGGIVPGDGIYTTWSHWAGHGRAQAWLLNPKPISAKTAQDWGVVSEVTPDGQALTRAKALAAGWLEKTDTNLRNTRIHFIQPLKERIVKEVGYGLSLEGASAAGLVKALNAKK